jgi:sugar lactone lactonase YvrE
LSAFVMANPTAHENPPDFEPDGTWYSLISARGQLFTVEPNHGELDAVSATGRITRVADISASQGHIVPTVVAYHGGNFYIGNLDTFPIVPGASKILKISPKGEVSTFATGFNTILGLVFDDDDNMYILENTVGAPMPTPGMGKVLRFAPDGKVTEIATELFLPTGMTYGPDGNLYVSNVGFGPPPIGLGQVLKITLPEECEDH